jgi:hypothetical protein
VAAPPLQQPARGLSSRPAADEALLVRAASGDRVAFEQLFESSFRRVWTFAVRRGADRAEADAVAAEVLTVAFARLGAGSPPELSDDSDFAADLLREARCALARLGSAACPSIPSSGRSSTS